MIELKNLSKTFGACDGGSVVVEALKDVSLTIEDGDIFGIIGMSGAGKSTLIRCINMLERPDSGQVLIDGVDIGALSEAELRSKRREITMIFQGFNLLEQRNCLKNVAFPLELAGMPKAAARKRAMELLTLVGLPDKAKSYPSQLSGGQQQRIGIARALATDPKVLLCDEATSALDPSTTSQILELIRKINEETGITVVIITHQMNVIQDICRNVAILDKGSIAEMGPVGTVFSRPKSQAAQNLVFPEGANEILPMNPGERLIRVAFNGAPSAGQPLITTMAVEIGICANILASSTKAIGGRLYGTLMLGISGGDAKVAEALAYLQTNDTFAEEVEARV